MSLCEYTKFTQINQIFLETKPATLIAQEMAGLKFLFFLVTQNVVKPEFSVELLGN